MISKNCPQYHIIQVDERVIDGHHLTSGLFQRGSEHEASNAAEPELMYRVNLENRAVFSMLHAYPLIPTFNGVVVAFIKLRFN